MTKPTSEPSDPICPTCKKPITDEDAVMHHNCLPPSEPRVELLTTNETSSKPVVPEPNQKPPSGPPREFWRKMYEKMSSPIDKFKYLCGLKELSWEDCQDAWFESQKLMPEIASAFDAVVAERDALAAQLAELRLAKPNAGSTDTLTEKYRLRRERDQLRSACEMLAKVLESVELYPNGHTNMRVKAALAQYEALKRQLAGEEK